MRERFGDIVHKNITDQYGRRKRRKCTFKCNKLNPQKFYLHAVFLSQRMTLLKNVI